MFFYLSQFLNILLMPLTIVLILLTLGIWYSKTKKGKIFKITGLVLLLIISNEFLGNLAMSLWEPNFKEFENLPSYEYGIVLSGVTNNNKTANDRTFFNKGADRATHALQLYKLGKVKKILITGGQGFDPINNYSEALLLKNFMTLGGVPEGDVIIEEAAKNTYQNAIFSKKILQDSEYDFQQPILLITSAFHMKRSEACFTKAGFKVSTFPVDYYGQDIRVNIQTLFYPNPFSITIWHVLIKEWSGLLIYKAAGYL
jgi:uncharacterized SAM-binding protein YcdF (DUF218 family)